MVEREDGRSVVMFNVLVLEVRKEQVAGWSIGHGRE